MLTLETFSYYKQFAYNVFDFLYKKINRYIWPQLQVDYADYIDYTFANIRRPSTIYLHLENIAAEVGNQYNKNGICSMIVIVLTHELFHVEQMMSQENYRLYSDSKQMVESAVNNATYVFLYQNRELISKTFGIALNLEYLIHINRYYAYEACMTPELIYKYTIMNVVFRNDHKYYEFESKYLDAYDNIVISFENSHNFLIKSNGEYCDQNINPFVAEVENSAGRFDRYTVNISGSEKPYRDKENVLWITFTLSNRQIIPIRFRDK